MKKQVRIGMLLLLFLLCLLPGSIKARAQTPSQAQGPELWVVSVPKGPSGGLIFKPDAPMCQKLELVRDETIYLQLFIVENGVKTPFDAFSAWTEPGDLTTADSSYPHENPDDTAIWSIRGLKCGSGVLRLEGQMPDGEFGEFSVPLTVNKPYENFCTDHNSFLSTVLENECSLSDLKLDLGRYYVSFCTACGIHGQDVKDFQVFVDDKPATKVERAPLIYNEPNRYALSIQLPEPVEGVPIKVQVTTPDQNTYTLIVYTDTLNQPSGIYARKVLNGDDPKNAVLTSRYVSQMQGEMGETQWYCLYEKDKNGTMKPLDLHFMTTLYTATLHAEIDVCSRYGAIPSYVRVKYLRPGEIEAIVNTDDQRRIPISFTGLNPQLGVYRSFYDDSLIVGSEVSYGLLSQGDLFLRAKDGFTEEDIQNCQIILDGKVVPFRSGGTTPRAIIVENDHKKEIRVQLPWFVEDQVVTVEVKLYHKNAEGRIFRHEQTLRIRDDKSPVTTTGLLFYRVDSNGTLCESAYPMDVLRVAEREEIDGIMLYCDPETQKYHLLDSLYVEGYYPGITIEPPHGTDGRFCLSGREMGTGSVSFTARIYRKDVTQKVNYETAQALTDLYISELRTPSQLATFYHYFVELPTQSFHLLTANGFMPGDSAQVTATLDGKPLEVQETRSARYSDRYDLYIRIPRPRGSERRLLKIDYQDFHEKITLDDTGHRWTPGLVVRLMETSGHSLNKLSYSTELSQQQGVEQLYQICYADPVGHVQPLTDVTLEDTAGLLKMKTVTRKGVTAWSVTYDRLGSTTLVAKGKTAEGQEITLQEPVNVSLPPFGWYRSSSYGEETYLDSLHDTAIAYDDLNHGELWMMGKDGFTTEQIKHIHLEKDNIEVQLPTVGTTQDGFAQWVPRAGHPDHYDLRLQVERPIRCGLSELNVYYQGMGYGLHIWDRDVSFGEEGLEFHQLSPEPSAEMPIHRELILDCGSEPLVGTFSYCDGAGHTTPLIPESVTVGNTAIACAELNTESGSAAEPAYGFTGLQAGSTRVVVRAGGREYRADVTVLLPKLGLYRSDVPKPETLVRSELYYETYDSRIWLLQEGGIDRWDANNYSIHAYVNGKEVTGCVCHVRPLPNDRYRLAIDLSQPKTPEGYMLTIELYGRTRMVCYVKPHPIMQASFTNTDLNVHIRTDRPGMMYAVRYENGRMMECVSHEMGPIYQDTFLRTSWNESPGSSFKVYALNPDNTPMCAPIDMHYPPEP